jgi:glycosyltransferase involved in cell wall biosynthesis
MKISIITANLNNDATIEQNILSVLNQCHHDIEHIIVDGHSFDGSMAIIHKYVSKHPDKIIHIDADCKGVYNAINEGIKVATGDIIGILHGNDCYASLDVLGTINEVFEVNPDVDFVYGDIHFSKDSNRIQKKYSAQRFTPSRLAKGFAPPHPSLYVRRQVIEEVGLYKEDYKIAGDFDYFTRLFLINKKRGKYIRLNMVEMSPNGLSSGVLTSLFVGLKEKYRSLKENHVPTNYFKLLCNYHYKLLGR